MCTAVGQLLPDQVEASKYITNSSVSSILDDIQSQLDIIVFNVQETDKNNSECEVISDVSSGDGQSSLGIPDSSAGGSEQVRYIIFG